MAAPIDAVHGDTEWYGLTISPMKSSTFEPIARRTLPSEIRQRLADAIHSGQLPPGTPIAAERVLSEEFGVARTSVREAIQGLVIAGYLERRGNRLVVAERLPQMNFTGDDRKAMVVQLFEVRQVIEPAIVELTARRASEDERRHIVAVAARTPRNLEDFRDTDREFHAALARACGNPMLTEVHAKALASLFGSGELASLLYADVNRSEVNDIITSSTEAHRSIADAVTRGHSRKAMAAVIAHLDDVEHRMVERLL
jgi:GntR family transcriptional repressor for pyruvate dehydrogenase complex